MKGISREECLRDVIDRLKENYPSFVPKLDGDFFQIPEKGFFKDCLTE